MDAFVPSPVHDRSAVDDWADMLHCWKTQSNHLEKGKGSNGTGAQSCTWLGGVYDS